MSNTGRISHFKLTASTTSGPALTRGTSLWAPVVLYMIFLFILSSIPRVPLPPVAGVDKVGHGGLYAVLGTLFVRALSRGSFRAITLRVAVLSVVYTSLYGISDEVHQHFVPPRIADPWDVAVDAIGAAVASAILYAWSRRQ